MDFSEYLQGFCPIHFPVRANDMPFFDNEADQALWNGLDQEQAPDPLVCLCPEVPSTPCLSRYLLISLLHIQIYPKVELTYTGDS